MRFTKRLLMIALVGGTLAVSAQAQTTSGTSSNPSGGQSATSAGGTSTNSNTATFNEVITVPQVAAITNTRASSAVSSQNAFGGTYWNPMTLGIPGSNNTTGTAGFGVATYGTTTGGGGARSSGSASVGTAGGGRSTTSTGNSTTFGSAVSGLGNTGLMSASGGGGFGGGTAGSFNSGARTGTNGFGTTGSLGGRSGIGGLNNNSASVIDSSGRDIAYLSKVGSPGPVGMAPPAVGGIPAVQTELRAMFDYSPHVSGNKSIQVAATHEGVVTLTGTVGSDEEKKLIEGMARITGGVRKVDSKLVVKTGG
jgi:BON domain